MVGCEVHDLFDAIFGVCIFSRKVIEGLIVSLGAGIFEGTWELGEKR